MTSDERWEFPDVVQIQYRKKGATSASPSRPAKVVVTRGQLEIHPNGNKMAAIILKTANIVRPPKRFTGKIIPWLSLNIVQNAEAQYTYMNLQIDDSKMESLVDTLLQAWRSDSNGMASSTEHTMITRRRSKVQVSNDLSMSAVQPRMATVKASKAAPKPVKKPAISKVDQQKIIVDAEDSDHSGFDTDFDVSQTQPREEDLNTSNAAVNQPPLPVPSRADRKKNKVHDDSGFDSNFDNTFNAFMGMSKSPKPAVKASSELHGLFDAHDISDSSESNKPSQPLRKKIGPLPSKPAAKSTELQGLFDEYGISESSEPNNPPNTPVHKRNEGRTGLNPSSYSSQARRFDKHYKPVDSAGANKSLKKKEGPSVEAFYKTPTRNQNNRSSSSAALVPSLESVDGDKEKKRVDEEKEKLFPLFKYSKEHSGGGKVMKRVIELDDDSNEKDVETATPDNKEKKTEDKNEDADKSEVSPAKKVCRKDDKMNEREAVNEYREIEREFNTMAGEVYRLEKKERADLVSIVKTIVKETVKRKIEGEENQTV